MNTALPKIWNTTFTDHTINVRKMDFHLAENGVQTRVLLGREFKWPTGKSLPANLIPEYIFFYLKDLAKDYRAKTPDWVMIKDGIHVISEKFRDFLAGFDLGANEIFDVPLYEFDQKTPCPGRWFIFHLCETKDTLVPEHSEGLKQSGLTPGFWMSKLAQNDVLAVKASSAEGADIWLDLHMDGRIFLSDRLKSALKPAGIRVLKMPIRPCVVVA